MRIIPNVNIAEYDYPLGQDRIAKYPLPRRDGSKLLIYKNNNINSLLFRNIADVLIPGSLLILNNSKVINARLIFKKATGAAVEVFILEPVEPADYAQSFASTTGCTWKCIVGNLKRWKENELNMRVESLNLYLTARKLESLTDGVSIEFNWNNNNISFAELIAVCGQVPIPPYLNRESEESDQRDYQTIYSKPEGSVAAPTAGFHFTHQLLEQLEKKGVNTEQITLHVGAGTFKPVKSESISNHEMHTEHFFVSYDLLQQIKTHQGNIVAVGTTTLRTLESVYWLGVKLHAGCFDEKNPFLGQWEAYQLPHTISFDQSLDLLAKWLKSHNKGFVEATTQLCIVPGYQIKTVDTLITNYHQPRSTLLLLVAAFIGEDWKKVYEYALKNDFRFLSYGDSSILFRGKPKK